MARAPSSTRPAAAAGRLRRVLRHVLGRVVGLFGPPPEPAR